MASVKIANGTSGHDHSLQQSLQKASWVMDVVPGKSVGPFVLGAPVSDVISFLRSRYNPSQSMEVLYDQQKPLRSDIVINLTDKGLALRFDAHTQMLKRIDITQFEGLTLRYSGLEFRSNKTVGTFVKIYSVFGPTYPGELRERTLEYHLHYPGVSFVFPIPSKYVDLYGSTDSGKTALPLEFPDGSTPVCKRISLHTGESIKKAGIPLPLDPFYGEPVRCQLNEGQITFSRRKARISLGTSAQEAMSDLGPPDAQYSARNPQILIHSSGQAVGQPREGDYFFNYFRLGIDVLFDGMKHAVKRVVLHTNHPGHVYFGSYRRCFFELVAADVADASVNLLDDDVPPVLSADSKWEDVVRLYGPALGDPVVFNGGGRNPFGPTLFYGYDGIIFEVMESGFIASVIIFAPLSLNQTSTT